MCEYYTLGSSSTDERRRRECQAKSADDTVLIHNHIDRLTDRPIDHIDRTASLRWQRLVHATAIIVGGQARQRSAGTTSPGPRLRNWWGSSALVITDSRVSFSDARICVTASPYVTRQSCSMWARPSTCYAPLRADNCDLHHITK